MRAITLVLLGLLGSASLAGADEQLSVLKVGNDIYSNVTVTSVTVSDIYFTHTRGIGSAKLKNLDPALREHFHYDAAKVLALELDRAGGPAGNPPDLSNPKAALDDATTRVRAIINQPVTRLTVTPGMDVEIYSPGWFHPGANHPDFNTVDVRTTQDLQYAPHHYVSSDLNPGYCFLGSEVEFNANTKFFYTDRTLPKKKLTEAEMLEINRLYRIVGTCEQKLGAPTGFASLFPRSFSNYYSNHRTLVLSVPAALLFLLMAVLNLRRGRSAA